MFRLLLDERSGKISVVTANSNNKLLTLVRRHQSGDNFWLSSYRSSANSTTQNVGSHIRNNVMKIWIGGSLQLFATKLKSGPKQVNEEVVLILYL